MSKTEHGQCLIDTHSYNKWWERIHKGPNLTIYTFIWIAK